LDKSQFYVAELAPRFLLDPVDDLSQFDIGRSRPDTIFYPTNNVVFFNELIFFDIFSHLCGY
jgi:hypothetical protein